MKKIMPVLLLAALPLFAADPPKTSTPPAHPKAKAMEITADNATFCDGTYALCIKAPCETTVSKNNEVRCKCVIMNGWSMGPNSCADRKANLTSTYSNAFNKGSSVLTCPKPIDWAWCYGSSCEKDNKDASGKTAVCRCPVIHDKPASILVFTKDCGDTSVCSSSKMLSAAYPKESNFANNHFANWMKEHGYPHEDAAPACPAQ